MSNYGDIPYYRIGNRDGCPGEKIGKISGTSSSKPQSTSPSSSSSHPSIISFVPPPVSEPQQHPPINNPVNNGKRDRNEWSLFSIAFIVIAIGVMCFGIYSALNRNKNPMINWACEGNGGEITSFDGNICEPYCRHAFGIVPLGCNKYEPSSILSQKDPLEFCFKGSSAIFHIRFGRQIELKYFTLYHKCTDVSQCGVRDDLKLRSAPSSFRLWINDGERKLINEFEFKHNALMPYKISGVTVRNLILEVLSNHGSWETRISKFEAWGKEL